MRKSNIFDFYIWNPLKKGIYISFVLNFRSKKHNEYSEYYILIGLLFCQITIDFKTAYYTIKNENSK